MLSDMKEMLPDMKEPTNSFLDVIEVESVTVEGIFNALMNHLKILGFHQEFLNENLISIATDGLHYGNAKEKENVL